MEREPRSTGALRRSHQWHRWFAWRPVFISSRAGNRRVVWLQDVERRWTEGITSGLGPRWIYRKKERGTFSAMRRLRHLAALYPERPWEFFHAVGDNLSQLHYLLAQFGVFRNVALNPVAIGLQLFVQRPEFSDETINFAHRSF